MPVPAPFETKSEEKKEYRIEQEGSKKERLSLGSETGAPAGMPMFMQMVTEQIVTPSEAISGTPMLKGATEGKSDSQTQIGSSSYEPAITPDVPNVHPFTAFMLPGGSGISMSILLSAALSGFVAEMKTQLTDLKKGDAALNRLNELKSPRNIFRFVDGYLDGLVAGIISPITALFDLAVFGEHLRTMAVDLILNGYRMGGSLMAEVSALGHDLLKFADEVKARVANLKGHPLDIFVEILTFIDEKITEAAEAAGRSAAKSVVGSFEKTFERKEEESWADIFTKRKKEESALAPFSFLNSIVERAKAKVLNSPWSKIGYEVGSIVGAVAINLVLLATTSGIGNAIVKVSESLGKIAPLLSSIARYGKDIGTGIAAVEDAIAVVANIVLRPLGRIFKGLEPLLLRLRRFLRRLLGLAEEKGGAAIGLVGRGAEELQLPRSSQPELKYIRGGGETSGPPRGKLGVVTEEGEVLFPPEKPPAQPNVATASELEEDLLATGTDVTISQPRRASTTTDLPSAATQQPPLAASLEGTNKPAPRLPSKGSISEVSGAPRRASSSDVRMARTYPKESQRYLSDIKEEFPRLKEAELELVDRTTGQGLFEERMKTSGGTTSFQGKLRDGTRVQLDDINESGFLIENKERTSPEALFERYKQEYLERQGRPELDFETMRHLEENVERSARNYAEQRVNLILDKDREKFVEQLHKHSRFVEEYGLEGGIWQINDETYKTMIEDLIRDLNIPNIVVEHHP